MGVADAEVEHSVEPDTDGRRRKQGIKEKVGVGGDQLLVSVEKGGKEEK